MTILRLQSTNSPKISARITLFILSTLLSAAASANTDCKLTLDDGTPAKFLDWVLPVINADEFDPNVPNGTVLYRSTARANGQGGRLVCPYGVGMLAYTVSTSRTGGGWDTYLTSIEGVGIRIKGGNPSIAHLWWPQFVNFGDNDKVLIMLPGDQFTLELVKIGKITAGGKIQGLIGESTLVNTGYDVRKISLPEDGIEVKPRVPSCALETKVVNVKLEGEASALIGMREGPKTDFNLRLQCSGGDPNTTTRMFIVFSDSTNPSNRSSTLSLSKDSTAKNVGIEILRDNGELVRYGPESGEENQWMVGEFGNVPVDIKLRARYVGTSMTLPPTVGSANANATFTISYK
ncbi:fimbrial protein [Comamonas thiooxydans]|uniref:fimbrial protein n=1 Tax=Comamonas thiooxydans TaxID=363952 RepID=UPI002448B7F5|nr:fimbrial protein [Comamonas thiooxydans]MDH1477009.1 fimbrial protein [Comamonas thiooxydans]